MAAPDAFRPRRSCLYMPGSNARAIEKARGLDADVLIFDLEDAVAPDAKAAARDHVVEAVRGGGFGRREIVVRVNAADTEWGADDLAAVAAAKPDAILLPKVKGAADLAAIDAGGVPLWAMVETSAAILAIGEIGAVDGLAAFVMGTNDLALEMRAETGEGREAFLFALSACVTAARAHGCAAIDGVFNDVADEDGLFAECAQGRRLGFDGKSLIHPAQLEAANTAFAPSAEAVERARKVIAAFDAPENAGKGVLKVDGRMTELLHLEEAQRTVAMIEAIADRRV